MPNCNVAELDIVIPNSRYVVNPMNFFLQDVVIDYPRNRILLRPRAELLPASL